MSQAFGSGTAVAVRPKSFPVARPVSKTPVVKKGIGNRFKQSRLKERYLRERDRLRFEKSFNTSGASGPTFSSPLPSVTKFQTRFESRPVTFKTAKNNLNTSPRLCSPGVTTKKSIIPIGKIPKTSVLRRGGHIHVSPAPVGPPTEPPSSSKTPVARNVDAEVAKAPPTVPEVEEETSAPFNEVLPPKAQTNVADVDDTADDDDELASLLCLVPLVVHLKESDNCLEDVTCYWPCLVIPGIHEAMVYHERLYPQQKKVQKRLRKKLLKAASTDDENGNEHCVVVLPLGNKDGCCPPEICARPLFDCIDVAEGDNEEDKNFWRTRFERKGKVIEGGNKIVRFLHNYTVVGSYLKESKAKIPTVGVALEQALMEFERLAYLDDSSLSDNETESDKENNRNGREFVSSLRVPADGDTGTPEPVRFPVRSPEIEKRRWAKLGQSNGLSTPSAAPVHRTTEPAIRFPKAPQKSRKRPSSSISSEKSSGISDIISDETQESNTGGAENENPTTTATTEQASSGANEASTESLLQTSSASRNNSPTVVEESPEVVAQNPATSKKRSPEELPTTTEMTKATTATNITAMAELEHSPSTKTAKKARTTSTPAKKKSPTRRPKVIDSHDRISVSSWREVKPLLTRLGHAFYDEEEEKGKIVQYFCKPNGDLRENPESVEGEDYFTSLSSYRGHLCAHGVDYFGIHNTSQSKGRPKAPLVDDDMELIAYWVRFHIFSQITTGERKSEKIPDFELSGNKGRYMKLLQRIGYSYRSRGLFEGYVIPGEKTKKFLTEEELWTHLAKHGLSPSCKFEKFDSKEEQMALDIQIIRRYHGNHGDNVFRPVDPIATSDDIEEDETEHPECTPAANKDALEECTRGPDPNDGYGQEAMEPRKLMTEETELDTKADSDTDPTPTKKVRASEESKSQEGVDTTDSFDAAHSSDSNTNVNGANQPPREKETINASAESTPNRATVANQQSVRTEEVPIAEVDLPGTTIAEKMSSCLQNLRKNEIVAHGQLSNSIARIRSFVEAVIESKGQKGDGKGLNQSPILYICGNPGTGKTMSTTTLCEEAISAQTESNEEWEKAPRLCHISCPSLQNFKYHDGMKRILERMGMKQNQLKRSSNDDLNAATILILDEVDQLLGSKGTESILRQLSSWAKDENNVLSIIGISNAVFNNKTYKLKEYGMGGESNKLVFQTYRKDDLVKMSQAKIGFTVVDKKAHEFIAAKVANSSGDARQYLDLVEKAITFCRRKLSLEKRITTHTKAVVTIRDAMLAIREINVKKKETIQSLTTFEKMTLCAGVHLARKLGSKTVTMGKLRELCVQAFGMDSDVSLEEFKGIIERLHDNGLLQLNEREKQAFTKTSMFNLLRYPVQFDLQLEDVDSALEDTLMKEDFYKRMVERLKNIRV